MMFMGGGGKMGGIFDNSDFMAQLNKRLQKLESQDSHVSSKVHNSIFGRGAPLSFTKSPCCLEWRLRHVLSLCNDLSLLLCFCTHFWEFLMLWVTRAAALL